MSDDSDLDLLTAEVEVEQTVHDNPGILRVVLALLVAGVLLAVVVSVIAAGISTIRPVPIVDAVCGTETSCENLSLADVRSLTGLTALHDRTQVVASRYEKTDAAITVTAELQLPSGAVNPFDDTGYVPLTAPQRDWPLDGLELIDYYGASGEQGTLTAEAVYATNASGVDVVLITVVRELA